MITVYQILLTDRDVVEANSPSFRNPPRFDAYRNMLLGGHSSWKEEYTQYYVPVMEIDTDDLNEAFDVSNGYGNSTFRYLSRGRSGSVGDIFVMDNDCYIVDSLGFTNVGRYELGELV